MSVRSPLAARGAITEPLATGAGGAAALPWWNPDGATPAATCGAWQAKGAASLAASYINLATLGHANIDPAVVGGVAPGWAAGTGWTLNGLTQYLISGLVPPNTQTWSVLVQYTALTNGGMLFGHEFTPLLGYFLIQPNQIGARVRYMAGGQITVIPGLVAGNLAIIGNQGYRNGAIDGAAIGATGGAGVLPLYIGAYCSGGPVPAGLVAANIMAFAGYNVTLTAPQVLARATAMAAL